MKSLHVTKAEAGERLIRYLTHLFPNTGSGFLYKMLRKKNILLNGKKAAGNESLSENDEIRIFFSDETFEKLSGGGKTKDSDDHLLARYPKSPFPIETLYENEDLWCVNKPAGVLSQKMDEKTPSMNEYLIHELLSSREITRETLHVFHPSVINRLDRNTSGILLFGKTMHGLQTGGDLMKSHQGKKEYHCIVTGDYRKFLKTERIRGYLKKDNERNIVRFSERPVEGSLPMEEEVHLLSEKGRFGLLSVVLFTGRSHQIRSSLSSLGCPLLNDKKYGGERSQLNQREKGRQGQYLHAYSITLPDHQRVICPDPPEFRRIFSEDRD